MERFEHNKWKHWMHPEFEKQQRRGRIMAGIIAMAIGGVFLAKQMGVIMPLWLFHWPVILILVGIFILGKHGFQRPGGLIPLTIGVVFMMEYMMPGIKIGHILWPMLIILFGLSLILSPWGKWRKKRMEKWQEMNSYSQTQTMEDVDGDYLNVDSVFGGVEKNIISKNFKGGKISCVFGGADINLLNADIDGVITMEINAVFGGVDITLPAAWNVKTEIRTILGGVEDKRPLKQEVHDSKVLILKGDVVFGGVSIKGY
jgi:hypothetical protein